MAFILDHLIARTPILDRNKGIAFQRLSMQKPTLEAVMPFMLRLANIESPQAIYFVPFEWMADEVLLGKLSRSMVLVADADEPHVEELRTAGYRIALSASDGAAGMDGADFLLTPLAAGVRAQPNNILTGIDTPDKFAAAFSGAWMYFNGNISMLPDPSAGNKRINPDHGLILELMGAIRREAEPKAIETLFRRDVTLSFKLLRYINSPGFGLNARVESVRHALSIIGYQQLLKWLTLLAATAGQGAAPALTHTAMVRARLLELMGAKLLEKNDADNLFMAGMLSLLDRIMGAPLTDILAHVNLPQPIAEALIHDSGKYRRFLHLAHACEGKLPPEDVPWADIDAKVVNVAHLEAVEWATQIMKTASEP